MIRYLPPPYSPKELKGAGFLSTLGRYSRPLVKKFLRLGKNIAVDQLSKTAAAAIKDGGNLLSKLAPLKKGGKKRSYKRPSSTQAFIHRAASLANSRTKKLKGQKQSSSIRGGKKEKKKKRRKGGKKGGKKKKAKRGGKNSYKKGIRKREKKTQKRGRKRFSVFDSL